MQVSCQCGAVSFKTPLPAPLRVHHCHCSHCRKQSASAFGTAAVFPTFTLPLTSQPIAIWARDTASGAVMECYFCKECGTRVVHSLKGHPTMNVRAGCVEGLNWKNAGHIFCADKVVDMEIPEGVQAYMEGYGSEKYVPKA